MSKLAWAEAWSRGHAPEPHLAPFAVSESTMLHESAVVSRSQGPNLFSRSRSSCDSFPQDIVTFSKKNRTFCPHTLSKFTQIDYVYLSHSVHIVYVYLSTSLKKKKRKLLLFVNGTKLCNDRSTGSSLSKTQLEETTGKRNHHQTSIQHFRKLSIEIIKYAIRNSFLN